MTTSLPVKSVATLTEADLDSELAHMYSRFKFGALDASEFFVNALTKLIQADQTAHGGMWQITHSPTFMQESGIHFLTELLAKNTNLPVFELFKTVASHQYHTKPKKERQHLVTRGVDYRGLSLAGKTIALLDDVCVTQTMLEECSRELFASGAAVIAPYVLIHLKTTDPGKEAYLNVTAFRRGGLSEIVAILNNPLTKPTNFWLTFLAQLAPTHLSIVRQQLTPRAHIWIESKLSAFCRAPVVGEIKARGWVRGEAAE